MPRFHFDLYNGLGYLPDADGADADDLAHARRLAIEHIRSLLSDDVRNGRLDLRGRIDIADARRSVLLSVPFRDAIELAGDVR